MRVLILSLLLSLGNAVSAQDAFIKEFEQKWKNAAEYTIEMAEAMPEEFYDFKPTEETRTYKEQLLHMMSNMIWLSSTYLSDTTFSKDLKKEDYTKEEVIALLKETTNFSAKIASNLVVEDLETKVDFFAGPMTKRQILVLMNDHLTHHRGQIIIYLRLKGIKPPKYRGW